MPRTARPCSGWCSPGSPRSGCRPPFDAGSGMPLGHRPGHACARRCGSTPPPERCSWSSPAIWVPCRTCRRWSRSRTQAGLAVLVDQAWGAHFGFHPGCRAMRWISARTRWSCSAHKTLAGVQPGIAGAGAHRSGSTGTGWSGRSRPATPPARRGRSWPASTRPGRCSRRAVPRLLDPMLALVAGCPGGAAAGTGRAACRDRRTSRRAGSTRRSWWCCCRAAAPTGSRWSGGWWRPAYRWRWPTGTRWCRS